MAELETERLILRQWKKSDLEPFYRLNSDVEVMRYFPSVLNQYQSNEFAIDIQKRLATNGWGLWALEMKESGSFIGFVGLNPVNRKIPIDKWLEGPRIEVGWRLAKEAWGKGYATEAAIRCVEFGFRQLNLKELVSFTSVHNHPSMAVMKRVGMKNMRCNFMHPGVPQDSYLREHVLFKIERE